MNIEKLIEAAKEIDRLAEKSSALSKAWQDLSADARKPDADRRDIERRRELLDAGIVVDFSTAIDHLRSALHAIGAAPHATAGLDSGVQHTKETK